MKINFSVFSTIFLEKSMHWLSDPEIKHLTNSPSISKDEQIKWFKTLKDKDDYKIWGISCEQIPIGACGLKNIKNFDAEYWGYIGDKKYWGKGIGHQILDRMEQEAKNLSIKSLWLKVQKDNERAIRAYLKMNYSIEKDDNNSYTMRKFI
jgi:RimJ/RimL family protein N-acetyltransferase